MGEDTEHMEEAPEETAPKVELDADRVAAFQRKLLEEQNLSRAFLAGFVAAIVGAAIWAAATVITKYQIGWVAVGVGFIVGYAVRTQGKGVSRRFGILGGGLALCGCFLGHIFAGCAYVAKQESISFFLVLFTALRNSAFALELPKVTFTPMNLLFYAIAVYAGYRYSFRRISQEELAALVKE